MKIIALILLIPISLFAQKQETTWDYPVKSGSMEWKSLKNNAEKVRACQVPGEVINSLSTHDLLQVCLKYPLLPDIFAFSNIMDGFDKFERDFNGFRALLKRSDVPNELLIKYKSLDPDIIPSEANILEKGNYVLSMSFLEIFITHPMILQTTDENGKMEFIKELSSKNEKKKMYPEWYQSKGLQTNYLAMIHLMEDDEPSFDVEKVFPMSILVCRWSLRF